jgi:putative hydrolase of the HAD superfamily
MTRGAIFDLFHTLTARESTWSPLPFTCDVLGIERARWEEVLFVHSRWRLAGEERDPFRMLRHMADLVDPAIPDQRIHEAVRTRGQRFRDALAAIPPANLVTLRRLRAAGLRLGLISNADAMEVAPWNDCPLRGLFDVEIFSCEVGWVKPEAEIFKLCLDRLGLHPEDCLYVGDGGSGELTGARQAGMTTVCVSGVIADMWPEQVAARVASADHHIEFIPEVEGLLGLALSS